MTCHRERGLTPWLTNDVGAQIKTARDAMDCHCASFRRGGNHRFNYGGKLSKEAFDRQAQVYGALTGRDPPSIYDWEV
jgi:hypothetical protein